MQTPQNKGFKKKSGGKFDTTCHRQEEKRMEKLKERIMENGIDYILVGGYYIPDLKLPEENRPIGYFGQMHWDYLKQTHPARYNTLVFNCELWTYLIDLDEQAWERLDAIMEQMKADEASGTGQRK